MTSCKVLLTAIAILVLAGCSNQVDFASQANKSSTDTQTQNDTNSETTNPVEPIPENQNFQLLCQKASGGVLQHGLQAMAYHSIGGANTSLDAIRSGTRINRSYVMNELLVPSRNSDEGFPATGVPGMGDLLRMDNGDVLKTYFALDLYSGLTLGAADEEGYYQFAVLSDDGVTIQLMNESSLFVPVFSDEGIHGPRVACAPKAVYLKHGATIPFRLTYFQGPATQVALTVIWRRWNSANPTGAGSQCNTSPQIFEADGRTLVRELRDAGWKAVRNENYVTSGSSEICYYQGQ